MRTRKYLPGTFGTPLAPRAIIGPAQALAVLHMLHTYGLRKTLALPNIEVHEVNFPKSYILRFDAVFYPVVTAAMHAGGSAPPPPP